MYYYNSLGRGKPGKWLARLRMGLSALNSHRYNFNFINSSLCDLCQLGHESNTHYFFFCPVHDAARVALMDGLRNININTNNQSQLLNILLHGTGLHDIDTQLIEIVSEYMINTNRFK